MYGEKALWVNVNNVIEYIMDVWYNVDSSCLRQVLFVATWLPLPRSTPKGPTTHLTVIITIINSHGQYPSLVHIIITVNIVILTTFNSSLIIQIKMRSLRNLIISV